MSGRVLEAVMMVCFGVSWPLSIHKTYKVKNPSGKSVAFLWLIIIGYVSGMVGKIVSGNVNWVIGFYALNTVMVAIDLGLVYYYRSRPAADRSPK